MYFFDQFPWRFGCFFSSSSSFSTFLWMIWLVTVTQHSISLFIYLLEHICSCSAPFNHNLCVFIFIPCIQNCHLFCFAICVLFLLCFFLLHGNPDNIAEKKRIIWCEREHPNKRTTFMHFEWSRLGWLSMRTSMCYAHCSFAPTFLKYTFYTF